MYSIHTNKTEHSSPPGGYRNSGYQSVSHRSHARERVVGQSDRDGEDRRLESRRTRDNGNERYERYNGYERYDRQDTRGNNRPELNQYSRPEQNYSNRLEQQHYSRPEQNYYNHPDQNHYNRPEQNHYNRPEQNHYNRPEQNHYHNAREQNNRPDQSHYTHSDYNSRSEDQYQRAQDSYRPRHQYQQQGRYKPQSKYLPSPANDANVEQVQDVKKAPNPDDGLSKDELLAKYERRLASLIKTPTLSDMRVIDSKWGVKPKGFENVTAQRAKLSGLFPLPGYSRPVDLTKLEGVNGVGEQEMLIDTSKIDPIDSINATRLIVKDIDFEKIDYLKVADYFNSFLKKVDHEKLSPSNNIQSKRKTKDDRNLIIEFKNNVAATIAFTLNGRSIKKREIKIVQQKDEEDAGPEVDEVDDDEEEILLNIARPGEYIVQCLSPYKEIKDNDIEDNVVDNPRKITLIVSPELTETQLIENLRQLGSIKGFELLRELGTKESLGIAFVEFYVDPKEYSKTIKAFSVIDKLIHKLENEPYIEKVFYSCLSVVEGVKTSIQDCPVNFNTLKLLVKNENVSTHPKLKVIQLLNIVTARDLVDDANFHFIHNDITQEVEKFGKVKSVKIPRPANDYTPGIVQFSQPGLGKVYVEFVDENVALNAIMGLAGRQYNDRTVLCAFYDHDDFKNGLL